MDRVVHNWTSRNEKLQQLATFYRDTAPEVLGEEPPEIKVNDPNDLEKIVTDIKSGVDEDRRKQMERRLFIEKLKEDTEKTREEDEQIARALDVTVEDLYQRLGKDRLEKSKLLQKSVADGVVRLASATKGYLSRSQARANNLLNEIGLITAREGWTGKSDVLTRTMERLVELGTGPDSSLTLLAVDLLNSVKDGKNYLVSFGEKQGQKDDLFAEALKASNGGTIFVGQPNPPLVKPNGEPLASYIEVAATIVDEAIQNQLKFRDILDEVAFGSRISSKGYGSP